MQKQELKQEIYEEEDKKLMKKKSQKNKKSQHFNTIENKYSPYDNNELKTLDIDEMNYKKQFKNQRVQLLNNNFNN